MHQIPVDTIIVYIKTNTFAIYYFILCFGRGSTVIFVFSFLQEDYNGITTFTELLNFTGKICLFFINKELLFL